jgi:glutamine amidotransferase
VIGVIDYRAGNAPSVGYALERLGIEHRLVSVPAELEQADRLVLPGVGAAQATMDSLADSELIEPLTRLVTEERTPFLGICIGLQVLFEHSEEGDTECLGWVPGRVQRFDGSQRIPQIGWNAVRFLRCHPVTAALPEGSHFYFVNSYHALPADQADVLGVTEYGVDFCSVVSHDNILATQFHAEKSGELGLRLLSAFATWDGRC